MSKFNENKGKVAAYNNSFIMANGEYIVLLGADDVNFNYRIDKQLRSIKISKSVSLVYGDLEVTDEKLKSIKIVHNNFIANREDRFLSLLNNNIISGGTMMINSEFKDLIFPIPENLLFEDWWIAFMANFYGEIIKVDEPLIKYRQHLNNDYSSFNKKPFEVINSIKKDYKRHFKYYNYFRNFINEKIKNEQKKYIYNNLIDYNILKRKYVLTHKLSHRIKLKKGQNNLKVNNIKNLIYCLLGDKLLKIKIYASYFIKTILKKYLI